MRKTEIGVNAGRVWHLLNEKHETSLKDLAHELGLTETETSLSVGWLARENKVVIIEHEGELLVSSGENLNFSFG